MKKRNLNRRQQWRIQRIQQERLERASRRQQSQSNDIASTLDNEQQGLVVAHHGQQVIVEDPDNELHRCHFRANLEQLVVGDEVLWQPPLTPGAGVVTAIMPRTTELRRPDPYGKLKPVAANIDQLLVVFSPLPAPSSRMLDRYLVAAELSGIQPVLVLNKSDLIDQQQGMCEHLINLYPAVGYPLLQVSASTGAGLDAFHQQLAGHTSALVGQSGVGKSSLVNALLPDAAQKTATLSDISDLGQHTTVSSRLFRLPDGGKLIDSPGIREFGLWHISSDALLQGYPDLHPLAAQCQFRNCSHHHEPGCALRAAAGADPVTRERLENFFQILAELNNSGRKKY